MFFCSHRNLCEILFLHIYNASFVENEIAQHLIEWLLGIDEKESLLRIVNHIAELTGQATVNAQAKVTLLANVFRALQEPENGIPLEEAVQWMDLFIQDISFRFLDIFGRDAWLFPESFQDIGICEWTLKAHRDIFVQINGGTGCIDRILQVICDGFKEVIVLEVSRDGRMLFLILTQGALHLIL